VTVSFTKFIFQLVALACDWVNYVGRTDIVRFALDCLAVITLSPQAQLELCEQVNLPPSLTEESGIRLVQLLFYFDLSVQCTHCMGPSIRTSAQTREKIDPLPLVRKISALAQPPLIRADTLKISKNLQFFASKIADVRI